jgi:hypothetical protein
MAGSASAILRRAGVPGVGMDADDVLATLAVLPLVLLLGVALWEAWRRK